MKALIIYDDFASGVKASTAMHRAAYRAKVRVRLDIKPWRVDVLKLPLAADEALMEAVDADLIVLAGPGAPLLPVWIKEWLECWGIRRQTRESALVVICAKAGGKPSAAVTLELSRFAVRNDLSFIVENNPVLAADTFSSAPLRPNENSL